MRNVRRLVRILAVAAALLPGLAAAPAAPRALAADKDAPHPLRGNDVKALLEKAADLEAKDPRAFGALLTSLGDPVKERGSDLEFLVEYATRETTRALRLLAIDSAQRIDAAAAANACLEKARAEKDPVRVTLAVEALGHLGNPKEHVPALLEILRSPSELVANAAADALARLGASKDVDEIVDFGLSHANSHVTDHTAWAVQDITKSPKTAAGIYRKIAAKKGDPRSVRAEATAALLEDKMAEAQKWTPPFKALREALTTAPPAVPVKGQPDYVTRVQGAIDWMKERMPAEHWQFCAAVKQVNAPGPKDETGPNFDAMAIDVRIQDAALPPNKIAYHLHRLSVVLLRKRIGEPWKGHRGWEPAIFDSYDFCVAAKLYDAGPGGLSRERFVSQIVGQRPWGGL